jgi:hypothetical protein
VPSSPLPQADDTLAVGALVSKGCEEILTVEAQVWDRLVVSAVGRQRSSVEVCRATALGELASAVLLVVVGVGSSVDLAPGEPRRCLLLVWLMVAQSGRTGDSVGDDGCSGDSRCGGSHAGPLGPNLGFGP